MTRRLPSSIVMGVTVAVVVGIAWWSFEQRSSPGPLHPSHAAVTALAGRAGCAACHDEAGPTAGGPADGAALARSCNACHEPIRAQIDGRSGIHGALDPAVARDCARCHLEHIGDSVGLVTVNSFARAGIAAPELYDHAHAGGLALEGRHAEMRCANCHVNADNGMIAEGMTRYLGLSQECTACHNDVHRGELGDGCAACHGQEQPFKDAALFAHPMGFPLIDGHAKRQCSDCHTEAGAGAGAARSRTGSPARIPLQGPAPNAAGVPSRFTGLATGCGSCHDSPHEPRFVEAARLLHGIGAEGDACAACHVATAPRWSDANTRMTPALHAATGFALVAPHDAQACVDCHAGIERAPAATARSAVERKVDFPGRTQDACESCHKDPHAGQFATAAVGDDCLACHARTEFVPTRFDLAMHASCGFPIDGAHRAVACSSCHEVVDGVRRFTDIRAACVACHEDVHDGAFDRSGMPAEVAGRSDCARCHTTAGFDRIAWTAADHAMWTGEALLGKHAEASCADCHRRGPAPARGAAPFAPAPKECAACHEDVHAGQFRPLDAAGVPTGAPTDCARCHRSTGSFSAIVFDHQRDARFALDADHAKLACAACHKPVAVRVGDGAGAGTGGTHPGSAASRSVEIVRYKPLGTTCADCHDARRGVPVPSAPGAGGSTP